MKYKIGQKVVYIGADYRGHPVVLMCRITAPAPRAIYTIRGGRLLPPIYGNRYGYVFEEIINPVVVCALSGESMETHIPEDLLRPLQARKNDGEAFVAGLRPLLNAGSLGRIRLPAGMNYVR